MSKWLYCILQLLTRQGIACKVSVYDGKDHFSLIVQADQHEDPLAKVGAF